MFVTVEKVTSCDDVCGGIWKAYKQEVGGSSPPTPTKSPGQSPCRFIRRPRSVGIQESVQEITRGRASSCSSS